MPYFDTSYGVIFKKDTPERQKDLSKNENCIIFSKNDLQKAMVICSEKMSPLIKVIFYHLAKVLNTK